MRTGMERRPVAVRDRPLDGHAARRPAVAAVSEQPWRDPGLSLDERLCHVLEHTVIVDASGKSVAGAVAILRETFKAVRADALVSGASYLETLSRSASPELRNALILAAAELRITPEEILAIGDNYNDLEMLLFAGTGVLMANAPLSLREISSLYTTASNEDDGVALAIEQFVFGNGNGAATVT